jgi:hypothetical protein
MQGRDPKKELTKEELQDPKKVQNLAPEPAKCQECGQKLPDGIDIEDQMSGRDKGPKMHDKGDKKMRHGQY